MSYFNCLNTMKVSKSKFKFLNRLHLINDTTKKTSIHIRQMLTETETVGNHRWNTDRKVNVEDFNNFRPKKMEENWAPKSDGFVPTAVTVGYLYYQRILVQ